MAVPRTWQVLIIALLLGGLSNSALGGAPTDEARGLPFDSPPLLVAQQRPVQPVEPISETLAGTWQVSFNYARGRMRLTHSGRHWQGRLFLNRTGRWENLRNLEHDPTTGRVVFERPEANQRFVGRVKGDRMAGTFQNGLKWSAQRRN